MSAGAKLKSSKVEVVLVGTFKPDEVRPDNLVKAGALTAKEAQSAIFRNLLTGQIVEFDLEWCAVQAVVNRLVVYTSKAPYVRVADLALKIVRESCTNAIVSMFGINREYQYKFDSIVDRDKFGIRFAPPEAWGSWGQSIASEQAMKLAAGESRSGAVSLTMRKVYSDDRELGWLDTTLSATGTDPADVGVALRANDHYQPHEKYDPQGLSADHHAFSRTGRLLDTLIKNFDESMKRSDALAEEVMK